jgi:hypothetical protein
VQLGYLLTNNLVRRVGCVEKHDNQMLAALLGGGHKMGRAEYIWEKLKSEGYSAIVEMTDDRQVEELFLDFKRSSDSAAGTKLSSEDRNNFARAISGFGNSEGGVVIWGVECSTDQDGTDAASAFKPLLNAKRHEARLSAAVSGCTVPPHQGVENLSIPQPGSEQGFVASYIPKANVAPLQATGKGVYYIRAGSSFMPAPHGVLAGLFGRVPQPFVYIMFLNGPAVVEGVHVVGEILPVIRNDGPGIARDLFMNIEIGTPGTASQIAIEPSATSDWTGFRSFGYHFSLVAKASLRLPPEAQLSPAAIKYKLSKPFDSNLEVSIMTGAGGSVPFRYNACRTPLELERLYTSLIAVWPHEEKRKAASEYFSLNLLMDEKKRPTPRGS